MGTIHDRNHIMDAQDFFAWQSATSAVEPFAGDDDLAADADEPPDHRPLSYGQDHNSSFQKSIIRPQSDRKESLLTRAFSQATPLESTKPDIRVATDLARRRSTMSIASAASTAELTSDGGITSPARTTTPSPPYPTSTYMKLAPYSIDKTPTSHQLNGPVIRHDKDTVVPLLPAISEAPKSDVVAEAPPRKRCISFACGAQKPKQPVQASQKISPSALPVAESKTEVKPTPKRCPTIKFACGGPKTLEKPEAIATSTSEVKVEERPTPKRCSTIKFACAGPKIVEKPEAPVLASPAPAVDKDVPAKAIHISTPTKQQRPHSRSPSMTKKFKPTPPPLKQRDSSSTVRQSSKSPVATRRVCTRKPTFINADEDDLKPSEATRFHEFASDEPQEDDWITKDHSETKARLTIKDTLQKENAIRQLGEEAEEEALDEDDEDDDVNDSDEDEDEDEEDEEDLDVQDMQDDFDGHSAVASDSDDDATDGNETDNEAGFADSDDESDGADGVYQFWTPGKSILSGDAVRFRAQAQRAPSESSIDSLKHMSPIARMRGEVRRPRARKMRIRPGTPDLPDSTDFVCGTLDEDRPLEDAYVSCMEQRKREKHRIIPQDIDPSFPTSDLENDDEEDDEDIVDRNESETDVWLHGKFEDSDGSGPRRRQSAVRKSPHHSPKRLHSPPPPKKRLGSPPPPKRLHSPPPPKKRLGSPPPPLRKLHSPPSTGKRLHSPPPPKRLQSPLPPKKRLGSPPPPKRLHSPPPPKKRLGSPPPSRRLFGHSPQRMQSPAARMTQSPPGSLVQHSAAIEFAPLGGNRPGITHTKSLPRTPNAFCRAYRASRLVAANGNIADGSDNNDVHTRGAIDILNGLQRKRERRTEKLYQKHCNRARKGQQVEKRPLPGKGAERMRELGCALAGKPDISKKAEYVISF